MASKKPPDWTKTGTVGGYAEYLRKSSDAICVLVIRPQDSVFALDAGCSPADAARLVADYIPLLAERMELARREKKSVARMEMGENRE